MINTTEKAFIQILSIKKQEVNNNGTFEIEIINDSSGDIYIEDNKTITFNKGGRYFIGWWVNNLDDMVVVSLLRKADMEVATSSNSPSKSNSIKGNAILPIKAGESFIFVNDSGRKINVSPGRSTLSINVCILFLEEV